MLPEKITKMARAKMLGRVEKLVERLRDEAVPNSMIALQAWLVGQAAWLLAPEFLAEQEARRRDLAARKHFGVCVWEPPCDHDAVTDDGLCAEHAAAQRRFDEELDGLEREMAAASGAEPS